MLQKHFILFAEGMRFVVKTLHLICRRHAPCSKTPHTIAEDMRFVAKVLHFSCRRHAHCCSSALLYLQKTRVLLQKHSILFTEGMRLVAKALHLFAEGVRPSSKALHSSWRRHAPGCKSILLYLQKAYVLLQKHSIVHADGMRLEAKAFNNHSLPV